MSTEELPLKSVVLFIACGLMGFILVFIFAKRQITRYALKSQGPHIPIGSDAPKSLRQEIERRLKRVAEIRYEPNLLSMDSQHYSSNPETTKFLYRMKAVDSMALLDTELQSFRPSLRRKAGTSLRTFLLELQQAGGPLEGIETEAISRFTDHYEQARHDPQEFQQAQYQEYIELLTQMVEHVRNRKNKKRDDPMGTDKSAGEELLDGEAVGEGIIDELGVEAMPPLASPDSVDVGIPAEEDDSSAVNEDNEDDEVQVTYKPLKSEPPSTGKLRMRVGAGGGGSSHSVGQNSGHLVDEGDQVSLCSGSSQSSSHLETQV